MKDIPDQLKNPEYKFFLAGKPDNKWAKRPIQNQWNTINSYHFFETIIQDHLKQDGNIGICTGYGDLIVIDFDNKEYQNLKSKQLPRTFVVRTALKGLRHYYFHLEGKMIKKVGIDVGKDRVADIQAGKAGIICPPSRVKRKFYSVISDDEIAAITCNQLSEIFDINQFKRKIDYVGSSEKNPKKIQEAINILTKHKIRRTLGRHYQCPFHSMNGNGNLYIMHTGSLYCFHCQTYWKTVHDFVDELKVII